MANEIKSTFGGLIVGEYVRYFIQREQRNTWYADIPAIAQGQLVWEDAARAERPALLILDTHLLSNLLWSRELFGDCPSWLEQELLARHYDLHLLLDPVGVPWVDDGQRCQPQLQQPVQFHNDCREWLERHQQPYRSLNGDWRQRRQQALECMAAWFTAS